MLVDIRLVVDDGRRRCNDSNTFVSGEFLLCVRDVLTQEVEAFVDLCLYDWVGESAGQVVVYFRVILDDEESIDGCDDRNETLRVGFDLDSVSKWKFNIFFRAFLGSQRFRGVNG